MRNIPISLLALGFWAFSFQALALDPYATSTERTQGMIHVVPPSPSNQVTITKSGGSPETIPPDRYLWVPIGNYTVNVKMQDYHYSQNVNVQPTELTDVVVPGFGNLEVTAPAGSTVEAISRRSGTTVAKFPASEVKILPQGHYDVRVHVGNFIVPQNNVWIITNTTRKLVVTPAGK